MTIDQVVKKLDQERKIPSRFPVRIIYVEDLETYDTLVSRLTGACDEVINIAMFCQSADIGPNFRNLSKYLSERERQQTLILSVGEYLRICAKRELNPERGQFREFWERMQPESSLARYILPMYCCKPICEHVLGTVDIRQQDFIWTVESDDKQEPYQITVYSPEFRGSVQADAENVSAWLNHWTNILEMKKNCTLITQQYRNVEISYGTVSTNVIGNPFQYLTDLLSDGSIMKEAWEPTDFWKSLIPFACMGETFGSLILHVLNAKTFDFISLAAQWDVMDQNQRELIWLWYQVYPSDEYYSFACRKAESASTIPAHIRDEILLMDVRTDEWIEQRMKAARAFGFQHLDDVYFARLDKLPLPETKLRLLTYQTHEEKAYAVKVISGLLRDGVDADVIFDMIKDDYPVLAAYINGGISINPAVDEYMAWYRKNKLINRFPGNRPLKFSLETFDARFKTLNKMQGKDCYTLWIDGFGAEWMPVLLEELEIRGIVPESVNITSSRLPTETEFNHQWDTEGGMSEKWDRLDKFSHKGFPDDKSYYSCIVHQLSVFEDAAVKIETLLKEHAYVAVTGDHGSSRLAALAFHDDRIIPITPPSGSTVHSFGRFCELSEKNREYQLLSNMTLCENNGNRYVVMNDYNHFKISGNAAGGNTDEKDVVGEVHGGNTPEERLVPVIIIKSSEPLPLLTCSLDKKSVKKRIRHLEADLRFNRKISALKVFIENKEGTCTKQGDNLWKISFEDVSGDVFKVSVVANECLLPEQVDIRVETIGMKQKKFF